MATWRLDGHVFWILGRVRRGVNVGAVGSHGGLHAGTALPGARHARSATEAVASISTRPPRGSAATATVDRDGNGSAKWRA